MSGSGDEPLFGCGPPGPRSYHISQSSPSTMPGSDSDEDIDDAEFDNDGEEDIDQEIFEAIEAGAEDATDGDPVGSQFP